MQPQHELSSYGNRYIGQAALPYVADPHSKGGAPRPQHPVPRAYHQQYNPTIQGRIQDLKPYKPPVKLGIHADSCYNYLNKRKYQEPDNEDQTPLEEFFERESIGQYKVAKIIEKTASYKAQLSPRKPMMKRTKKNLIVLDIDETLVHSELIIEQSQEKPETINKHYDRTIEFPNSNGTVDVYGVRFRPHLFEFIERLARHYDLAVYTASAQDYADAVLDQLDPYKKYFIARLYRDSCIQVNGMNIKNMKNFDGENVVLVDNLIYSYAFQMHQGIPICPFVDDPMDVELKDLAEILENISSYDSMAELIQDLLGLNEFYRSLEDLADRTGVAVSPALNQHAIEVENHFDRTAGGSLIYF